MDTAKTDDVERLTCVWGFYSLSLMNDLEKWTDCKIYHDDTTKATL